MASQIQVVNRQRLVKINSKWFKSAVNQLFEATLDNLNKKPVAFLSKSLLNKLKLRGVLSVAIVNNKEIQKLNKQWRGKDYATDVLSFQFDLDETSLDLSQEFGELVISAQKAEEQAVQFGHSLERELAFLFVHGLLHILGFDHERKEDEKLMLARQREILNNCGFSR